MPPPSLSSPLDPLPPLLLRISTQFFRLLRGRVLSVRPWLLARLMEDEEDTFAMFHPRLQGASLIRNLDSFVTSSLPAFPTLFPPLPDKDTTGSLLSSEGSLTSSRGVKRPLATSMPSQRTCVTASPPSSPSSTSTSSSTQSTRPVATWPTASRAFATGCRRRSSISRSPRPPLPRPSTPPCASSCAATPWAASSPPRLSSP